MHTTNDRHYESNTVVSYHNEFCQHGIAILCVIYLCIICHHDDQRLLSTERGGGMVYPCEMQDSGV